MEIDTLIKARWVIPVEPEGTILEHHALAINDGKILSILPAEAASERYISRDTRDLPHHALIPGLINAHTHAAMNLFRGLGADLPLREWLTGHIWPAEKRWVSREFVGDGTRHAVAEMIQGGITCFSDMYFFPDEVAQVAADAGIRATVGLIIVDFPTAWASDHKEYFNKGEAVHDQYRHHPLIRTAFAPHAPYTVSDNPLRHIAVLAEEMDIPIHMHLHETAFEVEEAVRTTGLRPLRRLEQLGLLSHRLLAVHMTQLEAEEIESLAKFGVNVIHCPESNMKLASGFCRVKELDSAGINVALGTDSVSSNDDLNMFGEMRTAALLAKVVAGDAAAVPAHQALQMATLNGARALGIDHLCGSLVCGKSADITAVELAGIETEPVYNPITQLAYSASRDKVSDVWIAGKQVLNEGALTTLDEQEILQKTRAWRSRIGEADAAGFAS